MVKRLRHFRNRKEIADRRVVAIFSSDDRSPT